MTNLGYESIERIIAHLDRIADALEKIEEKLNTVSASEKEEKKETE